MFLPTSAAQPRKPASTFGAIRPPSFGGIGMYAPRTAPMGQPSPMPAPQPMNPPPAAPMQPMPFEGGMPAAPKSVPMPMPQGPARLTMEPRRKAMGMALRGQSM